ncbi:HIT family protein [Candidatus Woesearchaeota archaeon]|nr:HIT family protein [Candidatus Woesearchaeota archaeon]
MGCELCGILAGEGKAVIIHEDDRAVIAVRDHVLTPGQITIFPREHAPILEMVSEDVLGHCAALAKAVSVAVFEGLGAKGTNILVRNGLGAGQNIPHFGIEVIPRQDNDGLNLQWEPKQLPEDELDRTFVLFKDEFAALQGQKEKPGAEETEETNPEEIKLRKTLPEEKMKEKEKTNYLLKSVKRIP